MRVCRDGCLGFVDMDLVNSNIHDLIARNPFVIYFFCWKMNLFLAGTKQALHRFEGTRNQFHFLLG